MSYAEKTKVDVGKSRDEIETLLEKRGATAFFSGGMNGKIFVAFELNNLKVRFEIGAPDFGDKQGQKQRWRALLLCIKAKMIAIDENIETFEEAFLAHFVTNGGLTVGDQIIPHLPEAVNRAEIKLLTA